MDAPNQSAPQDGPAEARENATQVAYDRMPQQTEVRRLDDDWTGITDPKLRRKLQNRLNQRAKRKRESGKVQKKAFPDARIDDLTALPAAIQITEDRLSRSPTPSNSILVKYAGRMPPTMAILPRVYGRPNNEAVAIIQAFEHYIRQKARLPCPSSDLLLHLVQYNVVRALILNTFTLGLTMEWLDDDAISPFSGSYATRPADLYPRSLRPTPLQKTKEHHPWIDLFPHAQMRDNMLTRLEEYDEDQLCADTIGWHHAPMGTCGMIVWKDPWDPSGWEISETFAKQWPWVVAGCDDLLKYTNEWREKRGERPIRFQEVVED